MEVDGFSCGACARHFRTILARGNHRRVEHRLSFKQGQGKCGCCSEICEGFFAFYDHFTQAHANMFHTIVTNDARRFGDSLTTPAVLLCDYFLDINDDFECKNEEESIPRSKLISVKTPYLFESSPGAQHSFTRKRMSSSSSCSEIRRRSRSSATTPRSIEHVPTPSPAQTPVSVIPFQIPEAQQQQQKQRQHHHLQQQQQQQQQQQLQQQQLQEQQQQQSQLQQFPLNNQLHMDANTACAIFVIPDAATQQQLQHLQQMQQSIKQLESSILGRLLPTQQLQQPHQPQLLEIAESSEELPGWRTDLGTAIGNNVADAVAQNDTTYTMSGSGSPMSQLDGVVKKEEIEDDVEYLGMNLNRYDPLSIPPRFVMERDPFSAQPNSDPAETSLNKPRVSSAVDDAAAAAADAATVSAAATGSQWKPMYTQWQRVDSDNDPDFAFWKTQSDETYLSCTRCGFKGASGVVRRRHFLQMHYPIYYSKSVLRVPDTFLRNLERFTGFHLGARKDSRTCMHCSTMHKGRAELLLHFKEWHREAFDKFRKGYEERRSKCAQPPEDDLRLVLNAAAVEGQSVYDLDRASSIVHSIKD